MDSLKQALKNAENVVVVGTTGPGRVTMIDSLLDVAAPGHLGVRVTDIADCPEIACG